MSYARPSRSPAQRAYGQNCKVVEGRRNIRGNSFLDSEKAYILWRRSYPSQGSGL